jgi:GTP pyrophosphokinase
MGISMASVVTPEMLEKLLKNTNFNTLEDLYAAIGYGGYTAQKVVRRAKEELMLQHRAERAAAEAARAAAEKSAKPEPPKRTKSEKGIIVEGLSNCLVKFAKCCTPVPGDEIIGFVTRGYGVSVHRKDCPNAKELGMASTGRWISVSWGDDANEAYSTALEVVCKDRNNLLVDISTALNTSKVNVASLNVRATSDGFAIFYLVVNVSGKEQLDGVINKIYNIQSVIRVSRTSS